MLDSKFLTTLPPSLKLLIGAFTLSVKHWIFFLHLILVERTTEIHPQGIVEKL